MPVPDAVLANAFHRTLQEICFTEKLAIRVNGRACRRARDAGLRRALQAQRDESVLRIRRLERLFDMIGKSVRTATCAPIRDLTLQIEDYLDGTDTTGGADTVLICWAQQIEAYWIGRYGTLKDWSNKLGLPAAEDSIDEALQDVTRAAAMLARLADDMANSAMGGGAHAASPRTAAPAA